MVKSSRPFHEVYMNQPSTSDMMFQIRGVLAQLLIPHEQFKGMQRRDFFGGADLADVTIMKDVLLRIFGVRHARFAIYKLPKIQDVPSEERLLEALRDLRGLALPDLDTRFVLSRSLAFAQLETEERQLRIQTVCDMVSNPGTRGKLLQRHPDTLLRTVEELRELLSPPVSPSTESPATSLAVAHAAEKSQPSSKPPQSRARLNRLSPDGVAPVRPIQQKREETTPLPPREPSTLAELIQDFGLAKISNPDELEQLKRTQEILGDVPQAARGLENFYHLVQSRDTWPEIAKFLLRLLIDPSFHAFFKIDPAHMYHRLQLINLMNIDISQKPETLFFPFELIPRTQFNFCKNTLEAYAPKANLADHLELLFKKEPTPNDPNALAARSTEEFTRELERQFSRASSTSRRLRLRGGGFIFQKKQPRYPRGYRGCKAKSVR
jgi:hypothetical protein